MSFMQLGMPFVVVSLGLAVACQAGKEGGEIRPPVVAGKFYPESAAVLKAAIEKFMKSAAPAQAQTPLGIVVPHAGYIYSGQICADGYNQVRSGAYEVVVIFGTNHTAPDLRKIALYPGAGFRTPLGTVPVDEEIVAALIAASPDCKADKAPHVREHSIEVQIPFIQVLFPQAKIVPAVVGMADIGLYTRFGAALAKVLKGKRALIVASSDLSHYPSAADAEVVDRKTLAAVASLDPTTLHNTIQAQMARRIRGLDTCACGEAPIMAAMAAAKALGAKGGRVVSYANSGDVPIGDRERVVGYGAVVFTAGLEMDKAASEMPAAADQTPLADRQEGPPRLRPGDDLQLPDDADGPPAQRLQSRRAGTARGLRDPQETGESARLYRPDGPGPAARHPRRRDGPPGRLRGSPLPRRHPPGAARSGDRDLRPHTDETGSRPRSHRRRAGRRPPPKGRTVGGVPPPGRPGTGLGKGRDAGQPQPEGRTVRLRLARGDAVFHVPGAGLR